LAVRGSEGRVFEPTTTTRGWRTAAAWCGVVLIVSFVGYGVLGDWGNTTTDDVGENGAHGRALIMSGTLVLFSGLGLLVCGAVIAFGGIRGRGAGRSTP
jgi:hypothetical protein